jgi:hypothetical protein
MQNVAVFTPFVVSFIHSFIVLEPCAALAMNKSRKNCAVDPAEESMT